VTLVKITIEDSVARRGWKLGLATLIAEMADTCWLILITAKNTGCAVVDHEASIILVALERLSL